MTIRELISTLTKLAQETESGYDTKVVVYEGALDKNLVIINVDMDEDEATIMVVSETYLKLKVLK
jgi:hypothetical protein